VYRNVVGVLLIDVRWSWTLGNVHTLLRIVLRILVVSGLCIVHERVPKCLKCPDDRQQESHGGFVGCRVVGQDRPQEKLCVPR